MHPIKIFLTLFLILFIRALGQSQSGYRACYGFDCKEKKWSFSVFTGFSLVGPAKETYDLMKNSGFDDDVPPYQGWSGYVEGKMYPRKSTGIVWSLESGYTISNKSGLLLTAGKIYQSTIKGHEAIGNGNLLDVKSDLWAISLNYTWCVGNEKGSLNIGPVAALYTVSAIDPMLSTGQSKVVSTFKPGFNVGYALPIVQKKSWFLTFKTNYTWLPDAEIGPYTSSHTLGYATENPEVYTSTFRKSKINLSTINIGLSAGYRF